MIEENLNYTQRQRTIRRAISLFIFCVIIVVQGLITYGIHVALQDADSEIAAQVRFRSRAIKSAHVYTYILYHMIFHRRF